MCTSNSDTTYIADLRLTADTYL